jgi:hypothetical protein
MAADTSSRSIYSGDAATLAEVLKPFAKKCGVSFCRYGDEAELPKDAKLLHGADGVEGHLQLLSALHGQQGNLSFSKGIVKSTLELVLKANVVAPAWAKMSEVEKQDWVTTMVRRIRTMCRAVSQGELKAATCGAKGKAIPDWIGLLPWRKQDAASPLAAASPLETGTAAERRRRYSGKKEPESARDQLVYEVGFDFELMLPWRKKITTGPKTMAEPGLPIDIDKDDADEDHVTAEWPDGYEHTIAGVTFAHLREVVRAVRSGGSTTAGELLALTHKSTNHSIVVRQKVDRHLLLVAYEQNRQILMVKLNQFHPVDDERHQVAADHPAVVDAINFLEPLLQLYCDGKIQKQEMNEEKKKLLKGVQRVQQKAGHAAKDAAPSKRPAAADAGPTKKRKGAAAPDSMPSSPSTKPKAKAKKAMKATSAAPATKAMKETSKAATEATKTTSAGTSSTRAMKAAAVKSTSSSSELPMPEPPCSRDAILFQSFRS